MVIRNSKNFIEYYTLLFVTKNQFNTMPIFTLITNVPRDKITQEILLSASNLVSELFDVTEKEVLVSIKAGVPMLWGTQSGIYALGTIQDTQPIQSEDTKQLAPAVFKFCEKHLDIPQNRMYLGFITLNPKNIAYNGRIYAFVEDE